MRQLLWIGLCSILPLAPVHAGDRLFLENIDIDVAADTVRLPLHQGTTSSGETVWYIVTEASEGDLADDFGVSRVNKLENAENSGAVQGGVLSGGMLIFEATVDFSPERVVVPDPVSGFPPLVAQPGAVAEPGYSPLVQLPDGSILNAPHVANDSGLHDSVESINFGAGYVDLELVDGFARDKNVLYISTEASSPVAAALEASTYTPSLNQAPGLGDDGSSSSRASLFAVTNGQTGVGNPDRQGLNSALMGEGDPRNGLAWFPNQGRYSPLWDVHLTTFAAGVTPELITRFADVEDLAEDGLVTAPDGSSWGPSNFIVNCPIVARVDEFSPPAPAPPAPPSSPPPPSPPSSPPTPAPVAVSPGDEFESDLSADQEVPAVAEPGAEGEAELELRNATRLDFEVEFEGLSGSLTAAHLHLGAAGTNGPVVVDLLDVASDVDGDEFAGTIRPGDVTGISFTELLNALATGQIYINLHTAEHPAGEIRGQLHLDD